MAAVCPNCDRQYDDGQGKCGHCADVDLILATEAAEVIDDEHLGGQSADATLDDAALSHIDEGTRERLAFVDPDEPGDLGSSETLATPSTSESNAGMSLAEVMAVRAEAAEFEPGDMIGPLYKVVRKLGQGGMGAIYEVEHERMKKRFAAKVLRPEISSPAQIIRLEREAISASSIEHPNILQVVNLDETEDGRVFLICELLRGHDLSFVVCEGAMPIPEALTISIQVASALAATHAMGIIHRDLKPENIFLAERSGGTVVKVLDFGISKIDSGDDAVRLTEAGSVIGTPRYMSPESASGEAEIDHRTDIYSLGIIIYEMVAGVVPFESRKPLELMIQHINEIPKPPSAYLDEIPARLDDVILKALEKDPDDRYATMGEFLVSLQELGEEFGVTAIRTPIADPASGLYHAGTPVPVSITGDGTAPQGNRWVMGLATVTLFAVAIFAWFGGALLPTERGSSSTRGLARPPAVTPAAKQAAPLRSAKVELALDSQPRQAEVFLGEDRVGVTPTTIEVDRSSEGLKFRFVQTGYKEATLEVRPEKTQVVSVTLEAIKKRKPKKKPRVGGRAKPKLRMSR